MRDFFLIWIAVSALSVVANTGVDILPPSYSPWRRTLYAWLRYAARANWHRALALCSVEVPASPARSLLDRRALFIFGLAFRLGRQGLEHGMANIKRRC